VGFVNPLVAGAVLETPPGPAGAPKEDPDMPTLLTRPDSPDEGDTLVMTGWRPTLDALAADPLLDGIGRDLIVRLYLSAAFAARDRAETAEVDAR
jgi:hypothetical protein